jgi:oligoribonuclease
VEPFVWVDLETTGLSPAQDRILELGIIVTDADLNGISSYTTLVDPLIPVYEAREAADPLVRDMHDKSGLWRALSRGTVRNPATVDDEATDWLRYELKDRGVVNPPPMCGSSVHFDRSFLEPQLPVLFRQFHYRNIDVSTTKELARRWYPQVLATAPAKSEHHRVFPDLRETIAEMRHYRRHMFAKQEAIA